MHQYEENDGSITTPFSENLGPLICKLEEMSEIDIRKSVLTIAVNSGFSEFKISEMSDTFKRIGSNRTELYSYVVNLVLSAKGLKAIPTKTRTRH